METARLNLDYCTIRSPISGRAGQRLVDIGNVVAANTGSLLVIERLDSIYADFTITENELTAVQRNMKDGTLKVEVRLPDEPKKPRDGKLTFLECGSKKARVLCQDSGPRRLVINHRARSAKVRLI